MIERSFPNTPASVGQARRFATDAVAGIDPAVAEEVVLMVSELATNSVRHAASEFTVAIERRTDEIRISVTDRGTGRPTLRAPASSDPSGRGLRIVQAFADRWGVAESAEPGKTVWFSVSLRSRPPDAASEQREERELARRPDELEPSRPRQQPRDSGEPRRPRSSTARGFSCMARRSPVSARIARTRRTGRPSVCR